MHGLLLQNSEIKSGISLDATKMPLRRVDWNNLKGVVSSAGQPCARAGSGQIKHESVLP